jgi:hypothetical protein
MRFDNCFVKVVFAAMVVAVPSRASFGRLQLRCSEHQSRTQARYIAKKAPGS